MGMDRALLKPNFVTLLELWCEMEHLRFRLIFPLDCGSWEQLWPTYLSSSHMAFIRLNVCMLCCKCFELAFDGGIKC